MSDLTKKYKTIIFYHTFRLRHNDKNYLKYETKCQNVLYEKSPNYTADGDNLKYQLQNSLNNLVDDLKELGDLGWFGEHYINIRVNINDIIVHVDEKERQKIRKQNQKYPGFAFDDTDDTDIVKPSAEKNSRYNNSMIQSSGGNQLKKKFLLATRSTTILTNHQLRKIVGIIIQ